MSEEASFHDGYRRALEEVSGIVTSMRDGHVSELGELLEQLDEMIERARCLCRAHLASHASGKAGY